MHAASLTGDCILSLLLEWKGTVFCALAKRGAAHLQALRCRS
jgi:hypothetical protein